MNQEELFQSIHHAWEQEYQNALPPAIPRSVQFPVAAFPRHFQEFMTEVVRASGFKEDYIGTGLLAICASAIGNTYNIRLKSGWLEPSSLFVALVGDPSAAKTPVMKLVMKPMVKAQVEYGKDFRRDLAEWKAQAEALDKGQSPPPKPVMQELIMSDTTLEALSYALFSNPKGLLMYYDELAGFFKSMNQYRKGSDQERWLSLWSSDVLKINRRGDDTLFLERPCISLMGAIQPAVLNILSADSRGDNGFIFRILFAYPEQVSALEWSEEELSQTMIDAYDGWVSKLIGLPYDPEAGAQALEFDAEAKDAYRYWYNRNIAIINQTQDALIQSLLKKMEAYVSRISLVLELMYWCTGASKPTSVSWRSVMGAIALIDYYTSSALSVQERLQEEAVLVESKGKIDWSYIFGEDEALMAKELVNRIKTHLVVGERTAYSYLKDGGIFRDQDRLYKVRNTALMKP